MFKGSKRSAVLLFLMAVSILTQLIHPQNVSAGLSSDFERVSLVDDLAEPTAFRFLPDGKIIIAEKEGSVLLFDPSTQAEPITLATLPTLSTDERGLLGVEPDPNFSQNGYLYISYTTAANHDRLSRFTMSGTSIDLQSEVVYLESNQAGNIYHHGGEVRIGSDGKLYWAMGMNTTNNNSQNLTNIHGKMLRLNLDGSVPADNPYVNTPNAIPYIWAHGLRNPFRFNFMPNDKLMAGDVGGSAFEELDIVARGGNYGWPITEGTCTNCPYVNPIYTYAHTAPPASAGSITAVAAYTGSTFPSSYQNKVFIADYTLGFIKTLEFDSQYESFIGEEMFDDEAGTVVQLDQGPDGNLYQLNIFPGELFMIQPSGGNVAPTAVASADHTSGLAPLAVNFSSVGSNDPEGQPITYAWNFGDGTTSTSANPSKTYNTNGVYIATLTVSDGLKSQTDTLKITVGSTTPTATITTPAINTHYNAGATIAFAGNASDAEDGQLPGTALSWRVDFHHADHIHPFGSTTIGSSGSFTIPTGADNLATTWYRVHLTATDSSGLTDTQYVDVYPNLVTLTWQSNYPDATFTIDGVPKIGTYSEQAVVGVERAIGAPSPQYILNGQYHFKSWSNAQPANHTIVTPSADTTYQVQFDKYVDPPAPWQYSDIGQPTFPGYSAYEDGVFTVNAAGGDIWGTTDEFHYVRQAFSGDGEIIARVTAQEDTDDWAKSGIMIKESAVAGAPYVLLAVTPANGITFQHNFNGDSGSTSYTFPNAWLKLKRTGNLFEAFTSVDGTNWTKLGQTNLTMQNNVTAGLAVTSHKYNELNTTVFDNVSLTHQGQWNSQDIGGPALAGSYSQANGTHTLAGSGDDIWGDADQMRIAYQTLPANGSIQGRLSSFTGTTDGWAKAGLIIKQSATAGSEYGLIAATPANGVNFQNSFNSNSGGNAFTLPNAWLRLDRIGQTVTGYMSSDGQNWSQVGSAQLNITGTVLVGMFVSAHDGSNVSTAAFDNIQVMRDVQATTLPAPWATHDVGAPRLAGSSSFANGAFTLYGAGDDIWGDADQFHFVHQTLDGDGEITARVSHQDTFTDSWAKTGVMIKTDLTGGSPYALLAATPANGATFQHSFNSGVDGIMPALPNTWLKLQRVGDTLTGYTSSNGISWTQLGTATIAMPSQVQIGLFNTSHNGSKLNKSIIDSVTVNP